MADIPATDQMAIFPGLHAHHSAFSLSHTRNESHPPAPRIAHNPVGHSGLVPTYAQSATHPRSPFPRIVILGLTRPITVRNPFGVTVGDVSSAIYKFVRWGIDAWSCATPLNHYAFAMQSVAAGAGTSYGTRYREPRHTETGPGSRITTLSWPSHLESWFPTNG
ncbi:hypothetical protein BD410DRAFT_791056 [Rickenella mellea]|uniref:DUF6699 domain-containing protein n=1 Tax=Rickenella mellea TaxID=50990 RepID=A0A4Y7PZ13_9AGAM|nr:hypothetical protein BD410DRAFT_791056 [Rickenella mellea]